MAELTRVAVPHACSAALHCMFFLHLLCIVLLAAEVSVKLHSLGVLRSVVKSF